MVQSPRRLLIHRNKTREGNGPFSSAAGWLFPGTQPLCPWEPIAFSEANQLITHEAPRREKGSLMTVCWRADIAEEVKQGREDTPWASLAPTPPPWTVRTEKSNLTQAQGTWHPFSHRRAAPEKTLVPWLGNRIKPNNSLYTRPTWGRIATLSPATKAALWMFLTVPGPIPLSVKTPEISHKLEGFIVRRQSVTYTVHSQKRYYSGSLPAFRFQFN